MSGTRVVCIGISKFMEENGYGMDGESILLEIMGKDGMIKMPVVWALALKGLKARKNNPKGFTTGLSTKILSHRMISNNSGGRLFWIDLLTLIHIHINAIASHYL